MSFCSDNISISLLDCLLCFSCVWFPVTVRKKNSLSSSLFGENFSVWRVSGFGIEGETLNLVIQKMQYKHRNGRAHYWLLAEVRHVGNLPLQGSSDWGNPFSFKPTGNTSSNIYVDRFSVTNWTHSYTETIIIMTAHKASHSNKTVRFGDSVSQITK